MGNLAPELRAAVQRATTDTARAEARRWMHPPEKSAHVSGRAVDVGPAAARLWLRAQGSRYGLCQTYANEVCHYELATAGGGTCPRPIADAFAG